MAELGATRGADGSGRVGTGRSRVLKGWGAGGFMDEAFREVT